MTNKCRQKGVNANDSRALNSKGRNPSYECAAYGCTLGGRVNAVRDCWLLCEPEDDAEERVFLFSFFFFSFFLYRNFVMLTTQLFSLLFLLTSPHKIERLGNF